MSVRILSRFYLFKTCIRMNSHPTSDKLGFDFTKSLPESMSTDVNVKLRGLPHDHELAVSLHLKKKTNKKSLKINKI